MAGTEDYTFYYSQLSLENSPFWTKKADGSEEIIDPRIQHWENRLNSSKLKSRNGRYICYLRVFNL